MTQAPASSDLLSRLTRLARLALGAAAVLALLAFLYAVLKRIGYPYELEWMEGSMVDHVNRLVDGKQIYVPPSIEFAPHGYPLLFFYSAWILSEIFGPGFVPLRLVSVFGTVTALTFVFLLVRRETRSGYYGLIAAGVAAATYPLSGTFFDIGRIDAIALGTYCAAVYFLRCAQTARMAMFAGLLYGTTYLAKQVALPCFPAFVLYLLLFQRRLLLPFAGTALAVGLGATLLMNLSHDNWYGFYTVIFQTGRGVNWSWILLTFQGDFAVMSIASVFALTYLIARFDWHEDRSGAAFYLFLFGATIGTSLISRCLSLGAYVNVLMPAYVILALGLGLGLSAIVQRAQASERPVAGVALLAFGAALVQFVFLAYDPRDEVPSAQDEAAGDQLVEWMRGVDGDVFLVGHGFLGTYAGKPAHVHTVGIYDAVFHPVTKPYILESVTAALNERRFAAVVTDHDWSAGHPWFHEALEANYTFERHFFDHPKVFMPVSGAPYRPHSIYRVKP